MFLKIMLILSVQSLLLGCAVGPDPVLLKNIGRFSAGTITLATSVNKRYDVTESAHRRALQNNLNLQLELGGTPDVVPVKLFSPDVRAARYAILRALQIYAGNLRDVYGREIKTILHAADVGSVPFAALKSLNLKNFDLNHSLANPQVESLISSLSEFSKLLFYPKRDRKVSEILVAAHPFIETAAILLYLDLGAPEDQHENCAYAPASSVKTGGTIDLQLCRGGVRGMMKSAIASSLKTWKLRLQLNSLNSAAHAERTKIVRRIYDLEHVGQQQDHLMQALQKTLLKMISAHQVLVDGFTADTEPSALNTSISSVILGGSVQAVEEQNFPPQAYSVLEFTIQVKSLSVQSESVDKFFENSEEGVPL
ncbi:MAG: hypothetical protein JKY04_05915 [Sneathiella sp.]|nr:hypothetical protein [Sneathiella sp.]